MSPRQGLKPLWTNRLGFVIVSAVWVAGCGEPESIRTYTVSRDIESENDRILSAWRAKAQSPLAAEGAKEQVPGRLLGALLPHDGETWIFKMLGDDAAVTKHVADVQGFVESVKFDGGSPRWTLPASWREKSSPGAMRYATLLVGDDDPPLELAVSQLPGEQNVADNVNRWRGQVQLPPQSAGEAEASAVEITTAAGPARWVDLKGKYVPGQGMAPFASGQGGAALPADHPPLPSIPPAAAAAPPSQDDLPVRFQTPAGWRAGPATQFSVASFVAGDADERVTITVSAASGEVLENVNRWRGQLQMPPIDQTTLEGAATPLKVDGRSGVSVELIGPAKSGEQQAIYGAIIDDAPPGKWFVKMMGDATVAFRERERFLAFVTSLKFVGP
jgi:hypothetical protein